MSETRQALQRYPGIYKRTRGGKVSYLARIKDTRHLMLRAKYGKSEISRSFDTRPEAVIWREKTLSELRAGTYRTPEQKKADLEKAKAQEARERFSFDDFWQAERKRRDWGAETLRSRTSRYNKHIKPYWGDVAVKDITREKIEVWVSGFPPDRRGTYVEVLKLFKSLVNALVDRRLLDHSPIPRNLYTVRCDVVQKSQRHPPHALTLPQLQALIKAAYPWLKPVVFICGYLGLRSGEVRALRRGDIDLESATLNVARALHEKDGKRVEGLTKTKKSRQLVMSPEILEVVKDVLEHGGGPGKNGLLFPKGATPEGKRRDPDKTRFLESNYLTRCVAAAGRQAGIEERTTMHDLRHTATTLLQSIGGLTAVETAAITGHADIGTVVRYSHPNRERQAAAVRRLTANDHDNVVYLREA